MRTLAHYGELAPNCCLRLSRDALRRLHYRAQTRAAQGQTGRDRSVQTAFGNRGCAPQNAGPPPRITSLDNASVDENRQPSEESAVARTEVTDKYPELFLSAADAILAACSEEQNPFAAAMEVLRQLAWQPGQPDPPPHSAHRALVANASAGTMKTALSVPGRAENSDDLLLLEQYQCRWCGAKTIDGAFLRLIGRWFPSAVPYHKNGAAAATHPAIRYRWPALDHEVAKTSGGLDDRSNLHCSCWLCNSVKSDRDIDDLGWTPSGASDPDWRGLRDVVDDLEDCLTKAAQRGCPVPRVAHEAPARRTQEPLGAASDLVQDADQRLTRWALDCEMSAVWHGKGRRYGDLQGGKIHAALVYLYPGLDRIEIGLDHLDPVAADELRQLLRSALASPVGDGPFPTVPLDIVVREWKRLRDGPLERFGRIWRDGT